MRRIKVLLLIFVLGESLTFASFLFAEDQPAAPVAGAKLDLKWVPADAIAAIVAQPKRALTSPAAAPFLPMLTSSIGKQQLGFEISDVEQAMIVVGPPGGSTNAGSHQIAFELKFANPVDSKAIAGKLVTKGEDQQIDGHNVRIVSDTTGPSCAIIDDRTLLVAGQSDLRWVLGAKQADSQLQKLLAVGTDVPELQAFLAVEPLRPMMRQQLMQAEAANRVPPYMIAFKKLSDLIDSIVSTATLTSGGGMQFHTVANTSSEQAAQEAEAGTKVVLDAIRATVMAQVAQAKPAPPIDIKGMCDKVVTALQPTHSGNKVDIRADVQSAPATVGMAVALILPAIQAGREAAAREQSANNLKQIGIGLLWFADKYHTLPASATFDTNGKPLLSWRVQILPFIEEEELYKQFHLDEPWDSEHNKPLIEKMPAVYKHPKFDKPGMTIYQGVVGKGHAFEGNQGVLLSSFTDGTSLTIMLVEASPENAVPWTKPADWEPDDNNLMKGLGGLLTGGIVNCGFADCHVEGIAPGIDRTVFKALLTRNGGEKIPIPGQ